MGEGVILYPATGTSEVLDGCGLTDSVVGRQARTGYGRVLALESLPCSF